MDKNDSELLENVCTIPGHVSYIEFFSLQKVGFFICTIRLWAGSCIF